jgi:PAS domain S-box-containing protein
MSNDSLFDVQSLTQSSGATASRWWLDVMIWGCQVLATLGLVSYSTQMLVLSSTELSGLIWVELGTIALGGLRWQQRNRQLTATMNTRRVLQKAVTEFSIIFRTSPDAIAIINRSTYRVIDVNDRFVKLFGYSREELLNCDVRDCHLWVTPDQRDSVLHDIFSQNALHNRDIRYRTKNGRIGTGLLSTETTTLTAQSCVLAITRDITDRQPLLDELQRTNEELHTIFDAFPDLLLRLSADGTYLSCRTQDEQQLFLAPQDLIGRKSRDVLPADVAEACDRATQQALETGEITNLEYSLNFPDKGRQYYEARVVPIRADEVIRIVRNITDRKQADLALQASEARFKALVEQSFDIIQILDDQLITLYQNAAVERILGFSSTPPIPATEMVQSVHPDDWPTVQSAMSEILSTPVATVRLEWRSRTADGRWVWLERIAKNWLQDPNLRAIVVHSRDISDRKTVELQLRESETRFRSIFEQVAVGINQATNDCDLIAANPAFCDIVGYSEAELRSLNLITDLTHPDDRPQEQERLQQLIRGEASSYRLEKRYIHKDGRHRWVLISINQIYDDGGRPLFNTAIVQDISDRKAAEEALHRSEQRFREFAENNDCVVWMYDPIAQRNLYVSPSFETIWQRNPQEIYHNSMRLLETVIPSDRDRVAAALTAGHQGEPYDIEYRIERPSGEQRWIHDRGFVLRDDQGEIYQFAGTAEDITDRKLAEQALQRNEQLFRAFADNNSSVVWMYDPIQPQLLYVSPAFETIWDRPRQYLYEQMTRLFDTIVGSDRRKVELAFYQRDSQNKPYDVEYRIMQPSGNIRWIHDRGSALRDEKGQIYLYAGIADDITDRKQNEHLVRHQIKREQALNQLIQAIRNSLDLDTIFNTAAQAIGQLMEVDRVQILQYLPNADCWRVVAEYQTDGARHPSAIGVDIPDRDNPIAATLKQHRWVEIKNTDDLTDPINASLAEGFEGSWLLVPLEQTDAVWGSLSLLHSQPRMWLDVDREVLQTAANQLAIAIQQANLYHKVQHFNQQLELQVQARTQQVQQALEFESVLKRITDQVRDSLEENIILQTAVEGLSSALGLLGCTAAIYDLEKQTSTIRYEATSNASFYGRILVMDNFRVGYNQLLNGQYFQFCGLMAYPERGQRVAMLACPIKDENTVLGDLWLVHHAGFSFQEQDIRLAEQVANQCAIALRQARLFEAAQAQVQELERLNHLKDDFLSTVSHELRTPMANIRMAIQMLELLIVQGETVQSAALLQRYIQILHDECDRETSLINDLLELSRLESGTEPLLLSCMDLRGWIPHIAQPFFDRALMHQQTLELDIPPDLPSITTDLDYLERILTELLDNACKYTNAHETVRVTARAIDTHGNNTVDPTYLHRFEIIVSNSGSEIPAHELPYLFDKFYRVPNNDPWKYSGTGLGLTLVQRRVQQIQGAIAATSQDNWTTFTLHLPADITPIHTPPTETNQPESTGSA